MIAFRTGERSRTLAVALLFTTLTVVFAYPLSVRPADHVMSSGPDANLFMWTLAWDVHALTHRPLGIFDANIYHPLRHTLAYSENLIGSAILAAPILWLADNQVLAMNLVALLSAVVCGVGAYALARQLGVGVGGAIVSGLVFAFSPPRFLRLVQLHLTTIQWVPFGLASLHAYFDGGRPFDLRMAAAFFTLQALTSGHGVVFLAVAMIGLAIFRVATGERVAPMRRVRDLGAAGVLVLLPTALMFVPYLIVQREAGLRRTLENWTVTSSSLLASPAHGHRWLLSFFPDARINETAEAYLFPGFLPIVLALAAVMGPAKAGRDNVFYALLTIVSVWLTLGPPIGLWPVVYWLPGFNFIRVPSRFMLLAVLGLAVLAGFGLEKLAAVARASHARDRDPERVALRTIGAGVICILLILEFAAMPLEVQPYRVEIPAIDRWLAGRPQPFVVAEVPLANPSDLGAFERRQTAFMLHSMAHWQKTVHGYSGLRQPMHVELYADLVRFPDEQSLASLHRFGVTYVVVHADWYRPDQRADVENRLNEFHDRLRLEHTEGEGSVYAVRKAP